MTVRRHTHMSVCGANIAAAYLSELGMAIAHTASKTNPSTIRYQKLGSMRPASRAKEWFVHAKQGRPAKQGVGAAFRAPRKGDIVLDEWGQVVRRVD